MEYKYSDITERIIKACLIVHNTLGNGFQEVIYQRALAIEFAEMQIPFQREFCMPIHYREKQIGERRVDFLIEEKICVELKALIQLENVHLAQAKNYLEAFNLEIGLLINFGANRLEWKRIFNNKFIDASK